MVKHLWYILLMCTGVELLHSFHHPCFHCVSVVDIKEPATAEYVHCCFLYIPWKLILTSDSLKRIMRCKLVRDGSCTVKIRGLL